MSKEHTLKESNNTKTSNVLKFTDFEYMNNEKD